MKSATEMMAEFALTMLPEIKRRMAEFGDTYEKAKSMVRVTTCCSDKVWDLVDMHHVAGRI